MQKKSGTENADQQAKADQLQQTGQKQKMDLAFVDNSKKRKRRELKGLGGYGLKMQKKKLKTDPNQKETSELIQQNKAIQQQAENENIIKDQETTLEELYTGFKQSFEEMKVEASGAQLEQDIKKHLLGNHERQTYYKITDRWSDARINKLKLEWFKDKKVLDIGCSNGIVDLLIAAKFEPKLIIGIDIDHRMIKNSIKNMQNVINDQEQMEIIYNELNGNKSQED